MSSNRWLSIAGLPLGKKENRNTGQRPYHLEVELDRGSCLIIVACSDSGKTDAGAVLAGLGVEVDSAIVRIAEQDLLGMPDLYRAEIVALIQRNPAHLMSCLATSVKRELQVSLEFLGRRDFQGAVDSWLHRLDLTRLSEQNPLLLSGGERIRAALAVVLVKKPQLLILDDVLAELDPHSSSLVRTALEQERRQGLTIVELHSRPPVTGVPPDAMWVFVTASGIIQGKLCDCWPTVKSVAPDLLPPFPLLAARLESDLGLNYEVAPEGAPEVAAPLDLKTGCHEQTISNQATNEESVALAVRSLEFEYAGGSRFHLGPMDCFFPRASATALLGRNGSGKTTLMACLGHLLKPMKGEISFSRGGPVARDPLHVWARTIVYSFQNPDDQIFLPTVRDEVLALAMMTGRAGRDADVRLEKVCKILELMPHLSDPPMDLPFPLRRLITVAGVFVAAPDIVLLDEPSAGLDRHQIVSIIRIVRDYCCFGGTVVFVSHDPEFVAETATHALVLEDGQVTLQGTFDELAPTLPLPMQSAAYVLAKELGLQRSICRYRDLLRSLYAKGSPSFQSGMG